jgi:hypothetical protein
MDIWGHHEVLSTTNNRENRETKQRSIELGGVVESTHKKKQQATVQAHT